MSIKTFKEWKLQIDEMENSETNFRMMGRAMGGATQSLDVSLLTKLRQNINFILNKRIQEEERKNPGVTADPGRLLTIKNDLLQSIITVVTRLILGDDAGSGATVNYNNIQSPVAQPQVNQ